MQLKFGMTYHIRPFKGAYHIYKLTWAEGTYKYSNGPSPFHIFKEEYILSKLTNSD